MRLWQAGTGSSALENSKANKTTVLYSCAAPCPPLPLSPAGIRPTGLAPRAVSHCRRKGTASPSAPGHIHTLRLQPCLHQGDGSVSQPKHGTLRLHVHTSQLMGTLRPATTQWGFLIYLLLKQTYGSGQTTLQRRICEEILFCFNQPTLQSPEELASSPLISRRLTCCRSSSSWVSP